MRGKAKAHQTAVAIRSSICLVLSCLSFQGFVSVNLVEDQARPVYLLVHLESQSYTLVVCSGRGRDLHHIIIIILIIIINYNNNSLLLIVIIITAIVIITIVIIAFLSVSHSESSPVEPCQALSSRVSQPFSISIKKSS